MKSCSTYLIIQEMQKKVTLKCNHIAIRMYKIKGLINSNVDEAVKYLEVLENY